MQTDHSFFRVERHAPISVWCARICFLAVICLVGRFWLESRTTMAIGGMVFFGGFIATSSAALVASFVRSRAALVLMIISIIAIPLTIF